MHTALVLKKLKTDWDAITGINTLIPGKLQEGVNTQSGNPYGRCEVNFEKIIGQSDAIRTAMYSVFVEVAADNPTAAAQIDIEKALDLLHVASRTGSVGGGAGEPSGSVVYAWDRAPGARSLQTETERRNGKSVVLIRKAMGIRVDWN